MSNSTGFKFSNAVIVVPLVAVISIWVVFWVELKFKVNLNHHGVYPRKLSGLQGIAFSPFIHGSLNHLYNNTIPLAVLSTALVYFYRSISFKVLFWGALLSGVITWLIGRPSYHIGASGIIYLLASFIFFKGIFAKHFRLIALSLIVVFVYGSMLWYVFPIKDGISWEGHLGGFLSGLFFALILKVDVPQLKKYAWEKEGYSEENDAFLQHFDENGNFIESSPEPINETNGIKITYHIKKEAPKNPSAKD